MSTQNQHPNHTADADADDRGVPAYVVACWYPGPSAREASPAHAKRLRLSFSTADFDNRSPYRAAMAARRSAAARPVG
jgi:hypothetical protein